MYLKIQIDTQGCRELSSGALFYIGGFRDIHRPTYVNMVVEDSLVMALNCFRIINRLSSVSTGYRWILLTK